MDLTSWPALRYRWIGGVNMAHPMGESKAGVLRLDFDRRLKLEFHGSTVTSDGTLASDRTNSAATGDAHGDKGREAKAAASGTNDLSEFRIAAAQCTACRIVAPPD